VVTFAHGWIRLLSVHRPQQDYGESPGRRRALAVEARLASLRLQHFKSDVAFDRVNSTRLSDQQHPGGLDQIGEHQPVTAFGDAAGAIGLARAVASRGQAEIGADIGGAAETP